MIIKVLVENSTKDPCLQAEHGLSLYMECGPHRILFDMGQTDAFLKMPKKWALILRKSIVRCCPTGTMTTAAVFVPFYR